MSTFAFPSITANNMTVRLVNNIARYPSPHTGAVQTKKRSAGYMMVDMAFTNLTTAERAEMVAFLAKLRGGQHRFTLPLHCEENRGTFGGAPLVNGANQKGGTITLDGATGSVTNWIRAGDIFQIGNEIKICTADANSSSGGAVTIEFAPDIRTSPSDNSAVVVSGAVGVFMLATDEQAFMNRPGPNVFSDFSVSAIEDIRA